MPGHIIVPSSYWLHLLDEAHPMRVGQQFRDGVGARFGHHVAAMGYDRMFTEVDGFGRFNDRQTLGKIGQYFQFPIREMRMANLFRFIEELRNDRAYV